MQALTFHGGMLSAARKLYEHAPEPWLDLSTGINPEPYPVPQISRDAWSRLPDAAATGAVSPVSAAAASSLSGGEPQAAASVAITAMSRRAGG